MAVDDRFSRLVSLACHDLRTPLATVSGFAHTLARLEGIGPPADRYIEMILAGSEQMAELLDDLALAARVEGGRFEPQIYASHTRELVDAAANRLGERATAGGEGEPIEVDHEHAAKAVAALALCASRHGGVDTVHLRAEGPEITISPVTSDALPVITGEEIKDLGALVANQFIEAIGGTVRLEGETLRISLTRN
jgi:signal transduction histidine kinase